MNILKFTSISKLKFCLLSEKYCLILGNSNSVSFLVNYIEQCFHYFADNAYTHTCKYCLLFINRKETKLMFKFRNICHLENTTQYGKQEIVFYTFPLTYICIFLMTIKCKIKSKRWLSLLVTIIKIHELKSAAN